MKHSAVSGQGELLSNFPYWEVKCITAFPKSETQHLY